LRVLSPRHVGAGDGEAKEATVNGLLEALRDKREALTERWAGLIFASYPPLTARFLEQERDRFRNPVGSTVKAELARLVDGLLSGADRESLAASLDAIVRVRAVQDFSATAAVRFVFQFKDAVGEILGESVWHSSSGELLDLYRRLDDVALQAFEIYAGCREQIFAIRAGEATARTYSLLKRAGVLVEAEEDESPPACPRPEGRS
jgi:hypothetical protein